MESGLPKIVDHDQRQNEILDAMWAVAKSEGVGKISLRNIASEMGMSKASLNHYINSLPRILGLAVQQVMKGAYDYIDSLKIDQSSTHEKAVKAFSYLVPTTPQRRLESSVWLLLISYQGNSPGGRSTDVELREAQSVLRDMNTTIHGGIRRVLQILQDNGLVDKSRSVDIETDIMHAIVDGLSLQALTDSKKITKAKVHEVLSYHLDSLEKPI